MLTYVFLVCAGYSCSQSLRKRFDCFYLYCIGSRLTSWQVLRYSALGAGIFYGLYHQAKLSSAAKLAAINREYEHKQHLIEKAKAEYSKKNSPPSAKTEGGDSTFGPVSDILESTAFCPGTLSALECAQ